MLAAAAGFLAGCNREQVAVYDAPKDAPPAPAAPTPSADPHGGTDQLPPRPGLAWKSLPASWTSKGPSGMRVANFSIAGTNGGQADLAVIPLPGTGGADLDLVNLWRSQLGLAPITDPDLKAHTEEASIRGETVRLFSIVGSGSADAASAANQILVAALRKEGFTWFFKLAGDAPTVASQRDSLKAFLGEVEFTAPTAPAMAAAGSPAPPPAPASRPGGGAQPQPQWTVPTDWTSVPPTSMIHSKWTIGGGAAAAGADVTVSVFPGETGGLLPNLNRWRSQVGLKPAPEAELNALIDNLEVAGGKGTLVDFAGSHPESGQPSRIVAAVVRRDGFSWFYKLLGKPEAVESQRAAFIKFVQTALYSRGA